MLIGIKLQKALGVRDLLKSLLTNTIIYKYLFFTLGMQNIQEEINPISTTVYLKIMHIWKFPSVQTGLRMNYLK